MTGWASALALTALVVLVAIPLTAPRAFARGWFERSGQTRRSRRDRRPTHGGLLVAVVLVAASLVSDLPGSTTRAVLATAVLAIVSGHRAERGRGPLWMVPAGWVAVGLAVPLCGVRAELTGTAWIDVVLTAVGVVAVIAGLDAVDHTAATVPAMAGVAAAGLLVVAVHASDPALPLAGALTGACLGLAAQVWPPAAVRVGSMGPMVLGAGLAIVAVEVHPSVPAPRSALVPLLALGLIACLGPLPRLDRRLADRRLPVHLVLPLAGAAGAFGAAELARGDLGLVAALVIAIVPAALVLLLARSPHRTAAEGGRSRRRTGPGRVTAIVIGVALVGVTAVVGVSLLSARRSMEHGRVDALTGLAAAKAGDLVAAESHFATANASFARATGSMDNPVVRLGDLVPVLAQNLRAARTLAHVGRDLSTTAVAVAHRAGADDLRVVDGRFPVEQARTVSAQLGAALVTLRSAVDRIDRVGSPFLVHQVAQADRQVRDQTADVTSSLEVAAEATRLLPALLGADGPHRWIVAIMSPSELRGSGGLLGDFAELRVSGGDISLVRSFPASSLNAATDPAKQAAVLPPVYTERYGGYHPNELWQNLSVTPDAVTMSQAIASAYPLTKGGGPVDGVVALDPTALAGLLSLIGPVRVPGWPVPITKDNAVEILSFQAYDQLSPAALEPFQRSVIAAIVHGLTTGALAAPSRLASALAPSVAGGHLRLWSNDPAGERLIERIGADGALRPPAGGDFIQLVTQNGSEAKIDWYLRRTLTYDAVLDPDTGHLQATATVGVTNLAPSSGVSSYIIGEAVHGPTQPGQSRMLVTVLTPNEPTGATDASGTRLPINIGREDGLYSASVLIVVEPGASATIHFTMDGALPTGSAYHLTVGHQATRVPDQVDLTLHGAAGWQVTSTNRGHQASHDDAPAAFVATLGRR